MRSGVKYDIPEEWDKRKKYGFCPTCGKHPEEFDKGMRVYCSVKCRENYFKRITTWDEMRDKAFEKYGKKCAVCKLTRKKFDADMERTEKKIINEWIKENRDTLEERRDRILKDLSEKFERDYKGAMDDFKLAERIVKWDDGYGDFQRKVGKRLGIKVRGVYPNFEVDHIVAIKLGGDEFDIENLQVLCYDCHVKKTKQDIKKIKEAQRADGEVEES